MSKANEDNEKMILDEGYRASPPPSDEFKQLAHKIRFLTNQHLLDEDKTDLKPSAVMRQSLKDITDES